jgi:hypothetical protein
MHHTDFDSSELAGQTAAAAARRRAAPQARRRRDWPEYERVAPVQWPLVLVLLLALSVGLVGAGGKALREAGPITLTALARSGVPEGAALELPIGATPAAAMPQAVAPAGKGQAREGDQAGAEQQRRSLARQRQAEAEASWRQAETKARLEREWHSSYRKPAECDEFRADVSAVACANHYIMERRKFEGRFKDSTGA